MVYSFEGPEEQLKVDRCDIASIAGGTDQASKSFQAFGSRLVKRTNKSLHQIEMFITRVVVVNIG